MAIARQSSDISNQSAKIILVEKKEVEMQVKDMTGRSHSSPVMTRNRVYAISTAVFSQDRIIETRFSIATGDRLPVPRTKPVWCKNIGFQHVLVKRNQVSSFTRSPTPGYRQKQGFFFHLGSRLEDVAPNPVSCHQLAIAPETHWCKTANSVLR